MKKSNLKITGTPAGNLVLIRKIPKEEFIKLASGIIAENSERKPDRGEVLLVGEEVKKAKKGDIVLFNQGYGSGAYDLYDDCVLLKEEAIMFYIK